MYFVGIDISKFKHDCVIINERGDTIQPSRTFANDREGFSWLKERIDSLPGEKRIGFEATGHYGQNLKLFLEKNGFTFMEFNPLLVSQAAHFYDNEILGYQAQSYRGKSSKKEWWYVAASKNCPDTGRRGPSTISLKNLC